MELPSPKTDMLFSFFYFNWVWSSGLFWVIFLSQNPIEFCESYNPAQILLLAYNIMCSHRQIILTCSIPNGSPSPPSPACSCTTTAYYPTTSKFFSTSFNWLSFPGAKWQQVSTNIQDSSPYSSQSQLCFGLNSLDSISDFQFFQFLFFGSLWRLFQVH